MEEDDVFKSPIPRALVQELSERFPDRMPDLRVSDREFGFKAGQVDVVRFLREQMEAQQETILGAK